MLTAIRDGIPDAADLFHAVSEGAASRTPDGSRVFCAGARRRAATLADASAHALVVPHVVGVVTKITQLR
jgi:hypothetical protein